MKLNAEQIIKALECCTETNTCEDCIHNGKAQCVDTAMSNALALIKQLTEENEAISERYAIQVVTAIELDKQVQRLTEENERLKSVEFTCGFIKPHKVLECPIFDEIVKAKADTVREMQERLDKHFCHDPAFLGVEQRLVMDVIDRIAKEMLEDNDG